MKKQSKKQLRIIIAVEGGNVQSVHCSEKAKVSILDYDNAAVGEGIIDSKVLKETKKLLPVC